MQFSTSLFTPKYWYFLDIGMDCPHLFWMWERWGHNLRIIQKWWLNFGMITSYFKKVAFNMDCILILSNMHMEYWTVQGETTSWYKQWLLWVVLWQYTRLDSHSQYYGMLAPVLHINPSLLNQMSLRHAVFVDLRYIFVSRWWRQLIILLADGGALLNDSLLPFSFYITSVILLCNKEADKKT